MARTALIAGVLLTFAAGVYPGDASAQNTRSDPIARMNTPGMPGGLFNPSDLEKFREVDDRTSVKAKARARSESLKLVGAMKLPCELTDAEQAGRGEAKVDGKTVDVNVYEVACTNGMGYFLEAYGPERSIAMSCFAADATHAADIAEGKKSELYCQLPANKDIKAMAGTLLTRASTECSINAVRWFGLTMAADVEYSEVACADGRGYLLKIPRTGPSPQVTAMTCVDAAAHGLKCHLTDGGPVALPITTQTFRDALKQNGIGCESLQLRVIGRESIDKRYVVEVECPAPPNNFVAFIPLNGSTKPFETLDCAAAVGRGVVCQLGPK